MKVVYHAAAMGNWQDVVKEQLALLVSVGLLEVTATFVGRRDELLWFLERCREHGVGMRVQQWDPNLSHYETFAMLHVERLARMTDEPILYFHTKGVSNPADPGKRHWRKLMEETVVKPWRNNLRYLVDHDVVGCNWLDAPGGHAHFSGNVWLANATWIRKLPPYAEYHGRMGLTRYSAEFWIGSCPGCRPMSHWYRNSAFWERPWRWWTA